MRYVVVEFEGPFRVGKWSLHDALDYVPSDTIYGALRSLSALGVSHEVELVSSAYPMLGGEPTLPVTPEQRRKLTGRKELKKVRFLPLSCWRGFTVDGGELLCGSRRFSVEELTEWGSYVVAPRNSLSRHTLNANPYRVTSFLPHVRYVIYYVGRPEAFGLLGMLGVGGERSVGMGRFRVVDRGEVQDIKAGEDCDRLYVLGTALPAEGVEAEGEWAVRSWWCGGQKLPPVSVLLDGSLVRGGPSFRDLAYGNCEKKLTPLWICS